MSARTIRLVTASALALGAVLASVPAAQGSFHEIKVREIYGGSLVDPDADFIELQMYSAGQNLVNGKSVNVHSANDLMLTNHTFLANLGNGANQSTVLLASAAAQTQFGVTADILLNPNEIDAAGGAVCWDDGATHLDCVAWGTFPEPSATTLMTGPREAAIPAGSSIVRSIAAGCPTALEAGDDTNNSDADFAPGAPTPRPNSFAPVDMACVLPPVAPTTPSAGTPGVKKRVRRCKKKPSKNAGAAKKKPCKKKKKR